MITIKFERQAIHVAASFFALAAGLSVYSGSASAQTSDAAQENVAMEVDDLGFAIGPKVNVLAYVFNAPTAYGALVSFEF